jgi:hypothetical protein
MTRTAWYKNTHRWVQINLSEIDARDLDVEFWQRYWKENEINGIIINAFGPIAYFPVDTIPQHRSKYLGKRDIFKELVDAARANDIKVIARIDSNTANKDLYSDHPDWFCQDINGNPFNAEENYHTCINGGYYSAQIPNVIREIIEKYSPESFADSSWASQIEICYCENCKKAFRDSSGLNLPKESNFEDPAYREWVKWWKKCLLDYYRRLNQITNDLGGSDCLWIGMIFGDFYFSLRNTAYDYSDLKEFRKAIVIDSQARDRISGYEQNGLNGMALHQVFGDDVLIINCVAVYGGGYPFARKATRPSEDVRTWMRSGIAGGMVPNTHFIGGSQDDKRMFKTIEPVMKWHKQNEEYLFNRKLVANIAVAWSSENYHFYGKKNAYEICKLPYSGFSGALLRRRIPYFPINCKDIEQESDRMDLLVLPDTAVLTDEQTEAIIQYIKKGKNILLTGATGMLDEMGCPRTSFLLDELLGIDRLTRNVFVPVTELRLIMKSLFGYNMQNYLRIPENRHEILSGFDDTSIIGMFAQHYEVRSTGTLETIATYIPAFPWYPPEKAYMPDDKRDSDTPVILAGQTPYGGRAVYFAADIDRRYGFTRIPDLGDILANAVFWAVGNDIPYVVKGPGRLDCKLYQQNDRYIMHILNLSGLNNWPEGVEEYYPVGPIEVSIEVGNDLVTSVSLKGSGKEIPFIKANGWVTFKIDTIKEHELIILEG